MLPLRHAPVPVVVALVVSVSPARAQSAKQLYERACAACHGSDGRGGPSVASAYPIVPPDFTDCSFASREPDADWFAVSHDGGPARGFDRLMPAFGDALPDREIELILDHVRRFCRDRAWPRGELNLPRAQVTGKAFPEDEAALRVIADGDRVTTRLVYARRVGPVWQLELGVPIVFAEEMPGNWTGGVGDISVSAKRVLAHSLRRGAITSAALEMITPNGDTTRGLGGGALLFQPNLTHGQLLTADAFVQLQVGGAIPYDRDRADALFARGALGYSIEPRPRGRVFTPIVEIVAARQLASDATTELDVVPQLQVTLNRRQHVQASLGVRVPVDEHRAERPTQLLAYIIWDWFDGGLLEGW